jgi:citronellyl-CoA dehydrogenase
MALFGPDHDEFRARLRAYVESEITPHADEWEEHAYFPRQLFQEFGSKGFFGLNRDPAFGGQGLDFGFNVVLAEELPRSKMMGLTLSLLGQTNIYTPLLEHLGTPEQKTQFLEPTIRGQMIGALGVTEPSGGSDIIGMVNTRARDQGDFWVVSGEKKFITNGPVADYVITLVRTRPEGGPYSLSLVVIPTALPGFRVKAELKKLGLRTSPTGWLEFEECQVPKRMTLGKPHLGHFYLMQNILEERLVGALAALSSAKLVFDDTVKHLQTRHAFRQPLSKLQAVRHRMSELAAWHESCRRFTYSVCESFRDGKVEAKEICMIKFLVYETVQKIVEQCLQFQGGHGFLEENWITRVYRDARALTIGGGNSELMKDLVATYIRL